MCVCCSESLVLTGVVGLVLLCWQGGARGCHMSSWQSFFQGSPGGFTGGQIKKF